MQTFIHPDMKDVTIDAVLYALADPSRRAIVRALAADKACEGKGLSCGAACPPDLPKATMSAHYTKLRASGVVRATRQGTSILHTLRCEEIEAKFPGLLPAILASREQGGDQAG
jgi:DNA-binding transcriptional ArsR family regulator